MESTNDINYLLHPSGELVAFPKVQAELIMAFPDDQRGGWKWPEKKAEKAKTSKDAAGTKATSGSPEWTADEEQTAIK